MWPLVLQRDGARCYGEGAAAAAHITAKVVVGDQLISAAGTTTGFVDHQRPCSDGASSPGHCCKLQRYLVVGGVLGDGADAGNASGCVASADYFIGYVVAFVMRVFICRVGAGDQHRLEAVGVKVDIVARHVVNG